MSSQIPEDALHKILAQIQQQVLTSTRELNMVRAQCNTVESQRKRTHLTLEQIKEEEDGDRLWNGVGKM
ncbi:hypothetical protein IE81DRAFT_350472 [Ceraceosorus guamensis]|uniref:Uncharacterized protein n=1 Tax=Ceraceosorus guamensis TaxID=1522189 RepID=A0A316VNG1_9BASI|nr:hypothetical protein IE81DRAFT_350472 [Ceraceosorus guamensis]PWN39107.1 hypothetical protein IE81DRAFT_350472 [Ceraceosorus guamensis]